MTKRKELVSSLLAIAAAWKRVTASNNCDLVNDMTRRARCPQPGDLVYEFSSWKPGPSSLGWLVEVTTNDHGEAVYIIDTLDGVRTRWSNAEFVALPCPPRSSEVV